MIHLCNDIPVIKNINGKMYSSKRRNGNSNYQKEILKQVIFIYDKKILTLTAMTFCNQLYVVLSL